jgi:hypothetical protein
VERSATALAAAAGSRDTATFAAAAKDLTGAEAALRRALRAFGAVRFSA